MFSSEFCWCEKGRALLHRRQSLLVQNSPAWGATVLFVHGNRVSGTSKVLKGFAFGIRRSLASGTPETLFPSAPETSFLIASLLLVPQPIKKVNKKKRKGGTPVSHTRRLRLLCQELVVPILRQERVFIQIPQRTIYIRKTGH